MMSGMSFNDRDDFDDQDAPSPDKFSSYQSSDDRALSGTGEYTIEEDIDQVVGNLERVATGRYEPEEIKSE